MRLSIQCRCLACLVAAGKGWGCWQLFTLSSLARNTCSQLNQTEILMLAARSFPTNQLTKEICPLLFLSEWWLGGVGSGGCKVSWCGLAGGGQVARCSTGLPGYILTSIRQMDGVGVFRYPGKKCGRALQLQLPSSTMTLKYKQKFYFAALPLSTNDSLWHNVSLFFTQ